METLTEQVAGITSLISRKFGGPIQESDQVLRTQVTHTHNSINNNAPPHR